jgi:hypothetical protein
MNGLAPLRIYLPVWPPGGSRAASQFAVVPTTFVSDAIQRGVSSEMLVAHRRAPMFFPSIIGDNSSWFACYGTPQNRPQLDRRLS